MKVYANTLSLILVQLIRAEDPSYFPTVVWDDYDDDAAGSSNLGIASNITVWPTYSPTTMTTKQMIITTITTTKRMIIHIRTIPMMIILMIMNWTGTTVRLSQKSMLQVIMIRMVQIHLL